MDSAVGGAAGAGNPPEQNKARSEVVIQATGGQRLEGQSLTHLMRGAPMFQTGTGIVVVGEHPQQLAELLASLALQRFEKTCVVTVVFGTDAAQYAAELETIPVPPGVSWIFDYATTAAGAVNLGIQQLRSHGTGSPPFVVVLDETARPMDGWLDGLMAALGATAIQADGHSWVLDRCVGFVGPVTDQTTSAAQRVQLTPEEAAQGPEAYSARRSSSLCGVLAVADALDGFCVLGTLKAWDALGWLNESLGSYAWVDAWVRVRAHGVGVGVADGCYVARTAQIRPGAWEPGNGADRIAFYEDHRTSTAQQVAAVVRMRLGAVRDLQLARATFASLASAVDTVVVMLLNNPLDILDDPGFSSCATLLRTDHDMLRGCSGGDGKRCAAELQKWISRVVHVAGGQASVRVHTWRNSSNEYEERSFGYRLAEEHGATWILVVEPGEVLEEGVTGDFLHRLARHPDPSVLAFDVALLTHWDSPDLIREDPPWGDGGTWRGGPAGVRLFRAAGARPGRLQDGRCSAAPLCSEPAVRAAAVRLRRFDVLRPGDRARAGVSASESIRCYAHNPENRMGFHALCYERENVDDVARWLDIAHGLCDRAVLVWTSPAEVPAAWEALAVAFGAEIVRKELCDDLASARNAGIDALGAGGALTWAWFVDPDEWLADQLQDARALRRMAESSRSGWLVQVANYRRGELPTISDSVRMSRLDGTMRMNGRVHEGFDRSIQAIQAKGQHPRLTYAPFVVQHRGMAFDASRMREKLNQYERLLRLELADNPHNAGAWVSLGWHYLNDGADQEGEECLWRAVTCAGQSYLPFRELAYFHLRIAKTLTRECMKRLTAGHQWWKAGEALSAALAEHVPDAPLLARDPEHVFQPLPPWSPPAR